MCLSKFWVRKSRDIGWDGKGRGQVFKTTKHKKGNLISKCTLILPMFDWNIIVCFRDKTKSFFFFFTKTSDLSPTFPYAHTPLKSVS